MTSRVREAAITFWMRYAEQEGALLEDGGDKVLMLLPRTLQERFGVPEEIAITADPDVARDDGAQLMISGHPLLDSAAAAVLAQGDAGTLWLAWSAKAAPATGSLVAAARDQIGVDHGRLDASGEAVPRYVPVLRVGVQVTYRLNDHFHELEELWVDARTGLPLPADLERRLRTSPRLDGKPGHPALEPSFDVALLAASARLEERAAVRLETLGKHSAALLLDERALVEAFYAAALESIAERRQGAQPERQAMFDAQAQATRAERARRLREIEDKFQARFEIRPVRLHLIWAPAMYMPVTVRRGDRGYALELVWWLPTASFAPLRCPACGEPTPLIAGKDRLGCRACMGRPVQDIQPAGSPPRASEPAPKPEPAAPSIASSGALAGRARAVHHVALKAAPTEAVDHAKHLEELAQQRRRILRTGDKLGGDFWEAVTAGDSWPRKRAGVHSPLRALYRIYGAEAPLRAVGIPIGALPTESTFRTAEPVAGMLHSTTGRVVAGRRSFPFTLRWRLDAGRPAVDEVLPVLDAWDGRLPRWAILPAEAIYEGAPAPRAALDPVGALLWQVDLPKFGLPLVARCLAAWQRIAGEPELTQLPPGVLAAALGALIARRAGIIRTRETAAADQGAEPSAVVAAADAMKRLLKLSADRQW
ncbi:MAG TPA: hypothetical protein VND96_18440 [Candidatus Micrarchaeaceae archaeon]|nr:hypothetical protein [Candidatus Micrarchaeaceae archaeon]